jgi:hypothetical protein
LHPSCGDGLTRLYVPLAPLDGGQLHPDVLVDMADSDVLFLAGRCLSCGFLIGVGDRHEV